MERLLYRVFPVGQEWRVESKGYHLASFVTPGMAMEAANAMARVAYQTLGNPSGVEAHLPSDEVVLSSRYG